MSEYLFEDRVVRFENPEQIIGMGGPWIGDLFVENELLSKNVLLDNLYFCQSRRRLYFIKYHLVSKWQKDNFFRLNFCDFGNERRVFEYDFNFDIIYMEEISNLDELIYFRAFHNRNLDLREAISLTKIPLPSHI